MSEAMYTSSTRSTDWLGLADRVCVVTGAAGGIGREIARRLLAAGARVALLDRDAAGLADLARGLEADRVLVLACDVTEPDAVQAAAARLHAQWGIAHVLVNNAAALAADAVLDIEPSRWRRLMAVNLDGYLWCAQAFAGPMREARRGAIVHVGSVSGRTPQPFGGAYSVSKAGVSMLSRLLAAELAGSGVRSNVVSPAMIHTPLSDPIYRDAGVRAQRERIVPAGRIGTPADIADAVLFLASDRASYVDGQELLVDGGLEQQWLSLIPRPGFERADATPHDTRSSR